jgi:hypothetical protein
LTNLRHKQALLHDPKQAVKFPKTTTAMTAHHMAEKELFNIEAAMASTLDSMGNDDLLSFAELYKDPTDDDQIDLYIYTCFLISKRTCSIEHFEQAIQRAKGWIADLAINHPDRARRSQILDMISASRVQLLEDVVLTLSGSR